MTLGERWQEEVTATRERARFASSRAAGVESTAYAECGRPADACGAHGAGYCDESVDARGMVRPLWGALSRALACLGHDGLGVLDSRVRRRIAADGITSPETDTAVETATPRPWCIDPIPLMLSAADWTRLAAGLEQRSRLLDAVLTDVYGPRRTLSSGLLAPEVVFGSRGYIRAAHGITVPGHNQLFIYGCDLSRWSDGRFRVFADRARIPSGIGYAAAGREVVAAAFPELLEHVNPRPLMPFARMMRSMLIESARAADEPVVVVFSPSVCAETAFEQVYLASMLGFPLVDSADLVVSDGALRLRSFGRSRRVDVVLRWVDAEFTDPLDLCQEARFGVPGLVDVARRGAVTVVNTLGSGLLESPALAGFLPRMSRALLGEELLLESVPSYWGGDDRERKYLLANLDTLIIRSTVDGVILSGPELSRAQRDSLKSRIDACGWQWVGREPAQFSVAPSVRDRCGLASVPIGIQLFALAHRGGYTVMPGGLGHNAARPLQRSLPDRVMTEAAAKDIWVCSAPSAAPPSAERDQRVIPGTAGIPPR
ncbi:circularly permuted type 2 ATP-grasp protein [Nocardia sp. 004]|uniref:circularly permuted type 2 ATP-grasp protein n=1 Tax=Nocardia sp. 004 TaxID=3385978 RepID=UPI0039A00D24